jgi:hypothetical protein
MIARVPAASFETPRVAWLLRMRSSYGCKIVAHTDLVVPADVAPGGNY